MIRPDHPTKSGSHSFNWPAVCREVVNYEGFFITQKARRWVMLNAPNDYFQINL
jgi:hypothetical protein